MRRVVIAVAICGLLNSTVAQAGRPFDRVATRVARYDEQYGADGNAPARSAAPRYREEVTPEPVAEPAADSGHWGGSGWDNYGPEEYYDDCCDWCCGPVRGLWGRAEYLYWWARGSNTPPLLTTSPDGTPPTTAGILPGATIIAGDTRLDTQGRSGGRFTAGYWLGNCDTVGIENTFFFLGRANSSATARSDNGSPILARPFFNTQTNAQDALLIGFPDVVVGSITGSSFSNTLGNEINMRRAIYLDDMVRLDVLAGYRFFYLHEGLSILSNTTSIDQGGTVPVGTTFGVFDNFTTRNQFHGGQLGLNWQATNCRWTLDLLAKVALGGVSQRVNIAGNTVITPPPTAGQPVTSQGGVLALNSNIGRYSRTQFGVLPEFDVNLHYQFSPLWRLNIGYTFMLMTNVVRPGDQIDLRIDPNQFPPPRAAGTFPTFAFHDSDIWLQGINFGLECNF